MSSVGRRPALQRAAALAAQVREEPAFDRAPLREPMEPVLVAAGAAVVPVHGHVVARRGLVPVNGAASRRSSLHIGRAGTQQHQKQHESTQHTQGFRE